MAAIQKKVCMVGVFATGKTSLVQRFVYSKFSERYHSTVGVKIDRAEVKVGGRAATLLLWDLAGRDKVEGIRGSYLRGSSGIVFVADGTRRDTLEELSGLEALVRETLGEIPAVIAVNKVDLASQWEVGDDDFRGVAGERRHVVKTSAKTGVGVYEAFVWLAGQMLGD